MARHSLHKRISAGTYRLLVGYIRSLFQQRRFHIKPGYRHRRDVIAHDDRGRTDEFQREVYITAAEIVQEKKFGRVMDVGCGSGYKLMKYLHQVDTIGVDTDEMTRYLREIYPHWKWIGLDDFHPGDYSVDLIICSDVIEHVADPVEFMQTILAIRDWQYLVISTPERDVKRGWYHFGPSPNVHHYREWNQKEFGKFLSEFVVVEKCYVVNKAQGTQMAVCSKRQ